eukprot:g1781.t1
MPSVFQVDHESRALLKDGVPFIMTGWFAGGYGHESAGLPPAEFVGGGAKAGGGGGRAPAADGSDAELLAALGQASLATEWGRQGHTFVRAGGWSNLTLARRYLDAAARAGLSVLWNAGVDAYARAAAGIPNGTGVVGNATEEWAAVEGVVRALRQHPAIGGWYACDDCCHMAVLDPFGPVEYEWLAEAKRRIRRLDPYHLMFGTVACGETWYWSEEGAGLGIDVVMKEGYGSGLAGLKGPYPSQYRVFPMNHEPLVSMPDPASLGSAQRTRAHQYADALAGDLFHSSFFVMNNHQFLQWQLAAGVSAWAAEAGELLPSLASRRKWAAGAAGYAPPDPPRNESYVGGYGDAVLVLGAIANGGRPLPAQGPGATSPPAISARVLSEARAAGLPAGAPYCCHHLVAVNTGPFPSPVRFTLGGLLRACAGVPRAAVAATRLFGAGGVEYRLNFTQAGQAGRVRVDAGAAADVDVLALDDVMDAGAVGVYRVGCAVPAPAAVNLVAGGDFERGAASTRTPGYLGPSGATYECARGNATDDRCRVNSDTAEPHGGRYAAKINLGSAAPVALPLPLLKPGKAPLSNRTDWVLEAWLRSSPPGVRAGFLVGNDSVPAPAGGAVTCTERWQQLRLALPPAPAPEQQQLSIALELAAALPSGGTAWLDDVSLSPTH